MLSIALLFIKIFDICNIYIYTNTLCINIYIHSHPKFESESLGAMANNAILFQKSFQIDLRASFCDGRLYAASGKNHLNGRIVGSAPCHELLSPKVVILRKNICNMMKDAENKHIQSMCHAMCIFNEFPFPDHSKGPFQDVAVARSIQHLHRFQDPCRV